MKGILTTESLDTFTTTLADWMEEHFVKDNVRLDFDSLHPVYVPGTVYTRGDYISLNGATFICMVNESSSTFVESEWLLAPYNILIKSLYYQLHNMGPVEGDDYKGSVYEYFDNHYDDILSIYNLLLVSYSIGEIHQYSSLIEYHPGDIILQGMKLYMVVGYIPVGDSLYAAKLRPIDIGSQLKSNYSRLTGILDFLGIIRITDTSGSYKVVEGGIYYYMDDYNKDYHIYQATKDYTRPTGASTIPWKLTGVLREITINDLFNQLREHKFVTLKEYVETIPTGDIVITDSTLVPLVLDSSEGYPGDGRLHNLDEGNYTIYFDIRANVTDYTGTSIILVTDETVTESYIASKVEEELTKDGVSSKYQYLKDDVAALKDTIDKVEKLLDGGNN